MTQHSSGSREDVSATPPDATGEDSAGGERRAVSATEAVWGPAKGWVSPYGPITPLECLQWGSAWHLLSLLGVVVLFFGAANHDLGTLSTACTITIVGFALGNADRNRRINRAKLRLIEAKQLVLPPFPDEMESQNVALLNVAIAVLSFVVAFWDVVAPVPGWLEWAAFPAAISLMVAALYYGVRKDVQVTRRFT